MKKKIVTSVLALTLCCAPVAVLSGCSADNSNVEIQQQGFQSDRMTVDGVRTLYAVGEKVDLNSATLALFDEEEFKIEKVDEEMISGFSSETVGKKTMSVVHDGHKVDVKYEVISAETIINEAKAILNEQAFSVKATNNAGEMVKDYTCNKMSIYDEIGGTLLKNHYGKWFEYSQNGIVPTQKYVEIEGETACEFMALLPSADAVSEIKVLDNETVQIKMTDGSLDTFKNKKLVSMERD